MDRLPRFSHAQAAPPISLAPRDLHIIRLVYRHRFLRSYQIVSLAGGSRQQVLRRLHLLFHHRYLERPRAQLDYYHQGGSKHIVYGLGNRGDVALQQQGFTVRRDWSAKNRSVGRMFLEHALLVSDVMTALELAAKGTHIRLLTENDLQTGRPFRWRVKLNDTVELGIVPDRVFALEYLDGTTKTSRAYFFLEADRGTMPVVRRNLSQTSFYRKLLAYEATWERNIHRTRFGFHRFRVVTVTTSPARVQSLIDACKELPRGHGLFLFGDTSNLTTNILTATFQSGRSGETTSLLG